jgi:putative transposase
MHSKRPRLRSFDYIGRYRYSLTLSTHFRQELFIAAPEVDLVLSNILQSAVGCDFAVITYCFMPDHLHLFVQGRADNCDLEEFVKLAKQTSGFAYRQAKHTRLWQPSYYDHMLRDDETSLWVIAYILRNPIVAGLVQRCEDYPFLGSGTESLSDLIAMVTEGLGPDWQTRDLVPIPDKKKKQA